jgi:uncharacterized protein (DUF1330 family)
LKGKIKEAMTMKAYVIFDEHIIDPDGIQEYIRQAPPILERYGGKLLTAGGTIETLEGDWHPRMLVILEFESLEQAKRWYYSDEYTHVRAIRNQASRTQLILVEGTQDIKVNAVR